MISERQLVHDLDLSTASDADLDFAVNFNLVIRHVQSIITLSLINIVLVVFLSADQKINSKAPMQAFVITFDTIFDAIPENKK